MQDRFPNGIPFTRLPALDRKKLIRIGTIAFLIFLGVTLIYVSGNGWQATDTRVASMLYAIRSDWLTYGMWIITTFNSNLAINIYSVLIVFFLAWRRHWREVFVWLSIVQGGLLLNTLVKNGIGRTRPSAQNAILHLSSFSFPSGHVAGAVLFYGALAVWITETRERRTPALFTHGLALVMVILIALSRVYLGVHFFSDVIAGAALALAWLCACLLGMTWLHDRRGGKSDL